ncbi:V-type ATP synthase subunit I [Clostridia bacterium]|nr:V-type ATP synthase subunit I [Clostridia bacterium]
MIEKMKYVNIAGYVSDIDRVIEEYISQYDIQLEPAYAEFSEISRVGTFGEPNPYAKRFTAAHPLVPLINTYSGEVSSTQKENAENVLDKSLEFLVHQSAEIKKAIEYRENLAKTIEIMSHFEDVVFNVEDLSDFFNIEYRFGKMPETSFKQFEIYLHTDSQILFVEGEHSKDTAWGAYFTPKTQIEKIDTLFTSLYFEVVDFPTEIDGSPLGGTPKEILKSLRQEYDGVQRHIIGAETETLDKAGVSLRELAEAYHFIKEMYYCHECRKYACKTTGNHFIFVGWMTKSEAKKLEAAASPDKDVVFVCGDENDFATASPPTKLKNNAIARPFEFFVRMYGVPSYTEIDPTAFVAFTYSLFFGMMYGDVGQGLALVLIGFTFAKKYALGKIMRVVGVSSAFFGFMYGSVFGFENFLRPVWLNPRADTMALIKYTICFGVLVLIVSMFFNMRNAYRQNDRIRLYLSANGAFGVLFYVAAVLFAGLALLFSITMPAVAIIIFAVIPILAVAFKEPIAEKLKLKKEELEEHPKEGLGMFLFVTLMELIETLLSFFTNTLSFVRVGGFAVCHAGLMYVVLLLSGAEAGRPNIIGIILGNAFVMGLEGLVVGIQVLRLEFYELFSRYYTGGGREFVPYKDLKKDI